MILITSICALLILCLFLYFKATKGKAVNTWVGDYEYAHRGLHNDKLPENSMAAFENAIEKGIAIETDVHLSKDGKLVLFHDFDLERMCGEAGNISDYTYDRLKEFRLLKTDEKIPLLSELLTKNGGKVPLLIEIKNKGRAGILEKTLLEELREYKGKFAVQSFSPFSMNWFYKNAPKIPRGQLSLGYKNASGIIGKRDGFFLAELMVNFISKPNFISYNIDDLPKRAVTRLEKSGLCVLGWTVKTQSQRQKGKSLCTNIIFEKES